MRIKFGSHFLVLTLILVVAFTLRIYKLSSDPPHLTPDEAALGYNAFSILKTGRDEYGTRLPMIFKSFGDYKPGFYIYLTVPSVFIFGLNEFSVRIPSAIAGLLSVYLIYLIVLRLFGDRRLALISSGVAAINPWLVLFSRGAWEANVSLTLTLVGIYFFLKSVESSKYFIYSAVAFSLTLLTYQGAKLSTAIIVLLLSALYIKRVIRGGFKNVVIACALGLAISLPILMSLVQGKAGRLTVFSVFSYPRPEKYLQNFLDEAGVMKGGVTYYLFYSEKLNFLRSVAGRWFNHFSGRFLFFEGDWQNPHHGIPNQGMFLIVDITAFLVGLYILFKKRVTRERLFILLWLVVAPLPAVLTRDQVQAVRALNMAIPMSVVIAFGLNEILKFRRLAWFMVIAYVLAFVYYLDALFIHLPRHNSRYWNYGYKQIVETITSIQKDYKEIVIQQSYSQPYIYFLFFQKYDPQKYQKQAKLKESEYKLDVGTVEALDNIKFEDMDWSRFRGRRGDLIVGDTIAIPVSDSSDTTQFKLIREIKYLDGNVAFRIIQIN